MPGEKRGEEASAPPATQTPQHRPPRRPPSTASQLRDPEVETAASFPPLASGRQPDSPTTPYRRAHGRLSEPSHRPPPGESRSALLSGPSNRCDSPTKLTGTAAILFKSDQWQSSAPSRDRRRGRADVAAAKGSAGNVVWGGHAAGPGRAGPGPGSPAGGAGGRFPLRRRLGFAVGARCAARGVLWGFCVAGTQSMEMYGFR